MNRKMIPLALGTAVIGWTLGKIVPRPSPSQTPIVMTRSPNALESSSSNARPLPAERRGVATQIAPSFPPTFDSHPTAPGWIGTPNATLNPAAPLRLEEHHPVPLAVRAQIKPLYSRWESAHAEDESQVDNLIGLYAPYARIYQLPDRQISVEQLRTLAINTRQAGYFTSVSDVSSLKWAQNARGNRVELLAQHRYGDDGGAWTTGQRRLVWERTKGKWKIVRDDFPPSYSHSP